MTWQATLKPYKHQITHLGRVDIVISAENFFFCCENSGVKRGKNPREGPDPTLPTRYPGMRLVANTGAVNMTTFDVFLSVLLPAPSPALPEAMAGATSMGGYLATAKATQLVDVVR